MPPRSPTASTPDLVLASASPRRRALLESLGLQFIQRPVAIDETPLSGEAPRNYVERLAREKAMTRAAPGEVVLAADTTVVLDGRLLGKPADAAEAGRMLARLSDRWHEVLTGVALFDLERDELVHGVERSRVRIARLSAAVIDWYVATGEPMDKAGAYAIQDRGALIVEGLEGNYTNVVGLPLPLLYRLCDDLGLDLLALIANEPPG
jgi:septum formation protein